MSRRGTRPADSSRKLQCLPRPRPSVTWAWYTWFRADVLFS